jgi:hypothetical protein
MRTTLSAGNTLTISSARRVSSNFLLLVLMRSSLLQVLL